MVEPIRQPKQKRSRSDKRVKPMCEARHRTTKHIGVTKKEFYAILDKASQPIKREAQSDSEKTET
jgi:hypothetical protein